MRNADAGTGSLAGVVLHLVDDFEKSWAQWLPLANLDAGSTLAAQQVAVHTPPIRRALESGAINDAGVAALLHAMEMLLHTTYALAINGQLAKVEADRQNGSKGGAERTYTWDEVGARYLQVRADHPAEGKWTDARILKRMSDTDPNMPKPRQARKILNKLGLIRLNGAGTWPRCQVFGPMDDDGRARQCALRAGHTEEHAVDMSEPLAPIRTDVHRAADGRAWSIPALPAPR